LTRHFVTTFLRWIKEAYAGFLQPLGPLPWDAVAVFPARVYQIV
jgi:hypothetical protein